MNNEKLIDIYTIGFTKKSAKTFFSLIKSSNITTLIDVRLKTTSQISGFAKKNDLKFFLHELCDTEYEHLPELAPTNEILNAYKKKEISWEKFEDVFLNLMAQRNIEKFIKPILLKNSCLLCSEDAPHHCHRRLVVDYLNQNLNINLHVRHLF